MNLDAMLLWEDFYRIQTLEPIQFAKVSNTNFVMEKEEMLIRH